MEEEEPLHELFTKHELDIRDLKDDRDARNPSGTLLPFLGSGFPCIIYQQKKGTLLVIWILGYQGWIPQLCRQYLPPSKHQLLHQLSQELDSQIWWCRVPHVQYRVWEAHAPGHDFPPAAGTEKRGGTLGELLHDIPFILV